MATPASVPTISAKWVRLFHFIFDHIISKVHDLFQFHAISLKKSAANELCLKHGDHVIVFCCGTGQEFPFIQERIGPEGEILGIDWSDGMLQQARRRIERNGWMNVKLVKGDVTALPESLVETASYDAGVCTFGLAMISEPEKAFQALKNAVRGGGRIVISDVCSFSGLKSILNPLIILTNFGGGITRRSLTHSRVFAEALSLDLMDTKLKWLAGGSCYIASGRRPEDL